MSSSILETILLLREENERNAVACRADEEHCRRDEIDARESRCQADKNEAEERRRQEKMEERTRRDREEERVRTQELMSSIGAIMKRPEAKPDAGHAPWK
ncbi:Hypothetical protein PHPALM_610 [Phytophthora palmivora]|uniref:Uncharacterized protein n=1 Tax=Phytophthora palmivora TaxID=4796 RepID=A0A2P4YUE9_9STRA|nr:Hypothetical protein PHPALM_610 [Phytophthora palmivora]